MVHSIISFFIRTIVKFCDGLSKALGSVGKK